MQGLCLRTLADAKLGLADLAPLYEFLCQEVGWNPDASQLKRMQSANQTKLQELEAKIKDAEENLGDTEVKEALTAKADYLCRIGTDLCQTGTYGSIHCLGSSMYFVSTTCPHFQVHNSCMASQ